MIASAAALLIPLALTTSFDSPSPSLHHDVKAFVTGYNTIPGQTDSTPCIAASGANICGRRDAVACPRRINLGTIVEIRGTTYVCEDRLAKKFDTRFDVSCDKDTDCPPGVTGWTTVKVYGEERPAPAAPIVLAKESRAAKVKVVASGHLGRTVAKLAPVARSTLKVAANTVSGTVSVLRGHPKPRTPQPA